MRARRTATTITALALVLAAGLPTTGCSSGPKAPEPLTTADRTLLPRLHVYPGEPVVVPLEERFTGSGPVAIAEDGTPLSAELRRITVEVLPPLPSEADTADRWMVAPGTWRSVAPSAARDDRGRDAVLAAIPADLDGRLVRIARRDYVVSVLAPAPRLPRVASGSGLESPWSPIIGPDAGGDLTLLARVRIEAQSPLTRWRYRLLVDGLDPRAAASTPEPDEASTDRAGSADPAQGALGLARFDDPTIEALAMQNERRWRAGLARLWGVSSDLCSRVRQRLSVIADFGNGLRAPAWPTDHARMDELLESLLDERLTPTQVAGRAEAWLADLPPATAWVVDDAGVPAGDGSRSLPTVGIVNLTDRATLAWATVSTRDADGGTDMGPQTPEPKPLPARAAVLAVVPAVPEGHGGAGASEVVAHAGEWSLALPLLPTVRATPPGLTMAPFAPDHTMDVWQRGETRQSRPEWTTAALLRRQPASSTGPARWEVLVECRRPARASGPRTSDQPGDARERVEVWFGEPGPLARAVIVHEDGRVERRPTSPLLREELGSEEPPLPVARTASGWSVRVPLPAGLPGTTSAAGAAGAQDTAPGTPAASARASRLLRMGIVRVDSAGRRSAWPRPMMPWQEQPGRVLIDMAAWEE